jgi:bifunctional NMN adenylyltransferase/nudix hydrolase
MLKTAEEIVEKSGVGVVVGRFQVASLTEGHKDLLDSVNNRHEKMIVVIGLSPVRATKNNPLDYETRRRMIGELYPQSTIAYIEDNPSDVVWSKNLDKVLSNATPPGGEIVLYGSRDSFQKNYHGRHQTKELLQEIYTSGTKERERLSYITSDNEGFRQGVIWATQQRFPTAYQAVDAAIIDPSTNRLLLARKKIDGDLFRFVGGFVDPSDQRMDHLEISTSREVREETGLEVGFPKYVCSMAVDDWRYRSENDSITTALFECVYTFGRPEPMDDIDELKWFDFDFIKESYTNMMVAGHQKLMERYIQFKASTNIIIPVNS